MKLISIILLFAHLISVIAIPAQNFVNHHKLNEFIFSKEISFWLSYKGRRAFIHYMSHLNTSFKGITQNQIRIAIILVHLYPTPEALVFNAFKSDDSFIAIKFLEQALGRDIIEDKLRLIKKQVELNPRKYHGNIQAKLNRLGYRNLTIEPLAERFAKLYERLEKLPWNQIGSLDKNPINTLMKESPLLSFGLLRQLTEYGADVDLAISKSIQDADMLQYLIKNGADVINYRDSDGLSPLHLAALYDYDATELLLNHGADSNVKANNGWTPLHFAVKQAHLDVVALLIRCDADVKASDNFGKTPLHYAAKFGYNEIAELLLQRGADIKATDKNGWTPLHYAAEESHLEVIKLLIDGGANVNATDNEGLTPLHWAAQEGHLEAIELLLNHDAELNALDNDGLTPLHYAVTFGKKEVIQVLLERGASISATKRQRITPLHLAAENGYIEIVQLLLQHGADINAYDNSGLTPLQLAAQEGHIDIVELLHSFKNKRQRIK